MYNCIYKDNKCVFCGYVWKRPGPPSIRHCTNHPQYLAIVNQAAERLGIYNLGWSEKITETEIMRCSRAFACWATQGFPERIEREQDICRQQCGIERDKPNYCEYARPSTCNYNGCGGKAHRPFLIYMFRMKTQTCPRKDGDRWAKALNRDS